MFLWKNNKNHPKIISASPGYQCLTSIESVDCEKRTVIQDTRFCICLSILTRGSTSSKNACNSEKMTHEQPHDKTNKMTVHQVKIQISLDIRPVWSESLLCAQWVAKDPSFLHADSKDWSDWADAQTDLSPRWVHISLVGFVMRQLILKSCESEPAKITSDNRLNIILCHTPTIPQVNAKMFNNADVT